MATLLDTFTRILFLDLRPWMQQPAADIKFRQHLITLTKPSYRVPPSFELSFLKPLNNFRKYYATIIDAEAVNYLNYLHSQVEESINENAKKYHVHMALTRTLNEKLTEVANVITAHEYTPELYDHRLGSLPANSSNTNAAFIIGHLQHQLVRLYLEVQVRYPNYFSEEALTEDDIYLKYFNHRAFTPSYIKVVPQTFIDTPQKNPLVTIEPPEFTPIKRDIRAENPKVLKYDDIINAPVKFALLETTIFQEHLIDGKYQYQVKPRGNNNKMAAVWVIAFNKGYFKEFFFKGGKQNVEFKHVKDFLSYRYNAELDQEPRKLHRDPEALNKVLEKNPWISLIPSV